MYIILFFKNLFLVFLRSSYKIKSNYSNRFIEAWIFNGEFADPFNEFLIDVNYASLISKGIFFGLYSIVSIRKSLPRVFFHEL
jgi:hypothetical protein